MPQSDLVANNWRAAESANITTTYKSIRVVSDEYSLYYSVWCDNEHEMYDMRVRRTRLVRKVLDREANNL
jgi:hypothetical protein